MAFRKRFKMSKGSSRRSFSRGVRNVKRRNFSPGVMRGGIRL